MASKVCLAGPSLSRPGKLTLGLKPSADLTSPARLSLLSQRHLALCPLPCSCSSPLGRSVWDGTPQRGRRTSVSERGNSSTFLPSFCLLVPLLPLYSLTFQAPPDLLLQIRTRLELHHLGWLIDHSPLRRRPASLVAVDSPPPKLKVFLPPSVCQVSYRGSASKQSLGREVAEQKE